MTLQATIEIDSVTLHLARPEREIPPWIGQREVLMQLLAAWSRFAEADQPLNPRLLGKPGVGKTTLACAAARELGLDIYIVQATMDTRPEDLLVTLHGVPVGHRHGPRSGVHPGRGQPDEREVVGLAGPTARSPAQCG